MFPSPSSEVMQGGGRPSGAIRAYLPCRLVTPQRPCNLLTAMRMAMAMVLMARQSPILLYCKRILTNMPRGTAAGSQFGVAKAVYSSTKCLGCQYHRRQSSQ
jgi:hypothetical protein